MNSQRQTLLASIQKFETNINRINLSGFQDESGNWSNSDEQLELEENLKSKLFEQTGFEIFEKGDYKLGQVS